MSKNYSNNSSDSDTLYDYDKDHKTVQSSSAKSYTSKNSSSKNTASKNYSSKNTAKNASSKNYSGKNCKNAQTSASCKSAYKDTDR